MIRNLRRAGLALVLSNAGFCYMQMNIPWKKRQWNWDNCLMFQSR